MHLLLSKPKRNHHLLTQRGIKNTSNFIPRSNLNNLSSLKYFQLLFQIYFRRELIMSSSLYANEKCLTNINTSNRLLSSKISNTPTPSKSQSTNLAAEKQQYHFLTNKTTLPTDSYICK